MTDRDAASSDSTPSWDALFERASAYDVTPDDITAALAEVRDA